MHLFQILGVLSQDGLMRFINTHTCKQLFQIGSRDHAINSAAVCPKGRHVVAVMDCGALRVYNIQALTQEINKVERIVAAFLIEMGWNLTWDNLTL